jgi:hypothetical protein
MPKSERGIVFTNDLDGVHFSIPIPLKTTLRVIKKDNNLPESGSPIGEYVHPANWRESIYSRWSVFYHQIRPVNRKSLDGLPIFKQAAEDHNRNLKFVALSGREIDKHDMTRRRLMQAGHMDYFTDLHLNPGESATIWKESVVKKFTESGENVVHIDDDLKHGMCIARVNNEYQDEERVLVYMMRNLSNHPRLLRRAGIETPENIVFVQSLKEAAIDFNNRLHEGRI